jgi:hypothetical protein
MENSPNLAFCLNNNKDNKVILLGIMFAKPAQNILHIFNSFSYSRPDLNLVNCWIADPDALSTRHQQKRKYL